jgi:hypothetical protein
MTKYYTILHYIIEKVERFTPPKEWQAGLDLAVKGEH